MSNHMRIRMPMLLLVATFGVLVSSVAATLPMAFAHSHMTATVEEGAAAGHTVRVVLGHSDEPAYGVKDAISNGRHNFEVRLSDSDTSLPLTGAELSVDKYYFKDVKSFENAESVEDADETQTGVEVGSIFGQPGTYVSRQLVKDGIYGYRLYGTIDFFGEGTTSIDTTVFCRVDSEDATKFNSPGWSGGFGCVDDIADTAFPEKNQEIKSASGSAESNSVMAVSTTATSTGSGGETASNQVPATLLIGLPLIGVAGYFGWRSVRKSRKEE